MGTPNQMSPGGATEYRQGHNPELWDNRERGVSVTPSGFPVRDGSVLQGLRCRSTACLWSSTPPGFRLLDERTNVNPRNPCTVVAQSTQALKGRRNTKLSGQSAFLAEGKCRSWRRASCVSSGGQMPFLAMGGCRSWRWADAVPGGGQVSFLAAGKCRS